ncbi:hypothetical protein [Streptomyces sp. NPDC088752]|uniref:hypothetical protein n=1 Tax=Streptomyces sp. NPDC088752 TaxID=3154963 RepID=UPI00342F31E0
MTRTTPVRALLIAALAAATLVGTVTSANAESAQPANGDAYVANPNDPGLIELYSAPEPGQMGPMNWDGAIGSWAPGSFESRHWDDNDYTEVRFVGCVVDQGGGKSAGVKLWQAIPFSLDKDMGTQTYYNCFTGPSASTLAWWNVHYEDGDQRYFTIPQINGSTTIRATMSVKKVYVDTTLAD